MSDVEGITRALQYYIEGARSGSSATMSRAFHESATIFGYEDEGLFAGPIQRLLDWNESNGPAEALQARIVSIDAADTVAMARVEIDNWSGTNYIDLFTLIKVGDDWKITNKVFRVLARVG